MSQWTHVNASIRFDGLLGMGLPTENDLDAICTYEDWKDTDMPCGSEGGLQYSIVRNPDTSCMAAMVVVFYGDLRDYDDASEIIEYFNKITNGKMIRNGVLEIEVEFKETLIYRYDSEGEEWVKCG